MTNHKGNKNAMINLAVNNVIRMSSNNKDPGMPTQPAPFGHDPALGSRIATR